MEKMMFARMNSEWRSGKWTGGNSGFAFTAMMHLKSTHPYWVSVSSSVMVGKDPYLGGLLGGWNDMKQNEIKTMQVERLSPGYDTR